MNPIYVDQIARAMNKAAGWNDYQDIAKSKAALTYFIEKLEEFLNECPNVENGSCSTFWRHEDCNLLMKILYDITVDSKYRTKY